MIDLLQKLKIFLGFDLRPEELQTERVAGTPPVAPAPVVPPPVAPDAVVPAPVAAAAVVPDAVEGSLTFDTVLAGLQGYTIVPVGGGRYQASKFGSMPLGDLAVRLQQLARMSYEWQAEDGDGTPFAAHFGLEGPGWTIDLTIGREAECVEYQVGWQDGWGRRAPAAGRAPWQNVLWALLLWPDGAAVADFLDAQRAEYPDRTM